MNMSYQQSSTHQWVQFSLDAVGWDPMEMIVTMRFIPIVSVIYIYILIRILKITIQCSYSCCILNLESQKQTQGKPYGGE